MVTAAWSAYFKCNGWVAEPMRAALDAIAPMVEKLIAERENAAAHEAQSGISGTPW